MASEGVSECLQKLAVQFREPQNQLLCPMG